MPDQTRSSTVRSVRDIETLVARIRDYDYGHRRTNLVALEQLINATYNDREARLRIETAMAGLLGSQATVAAKQFVCKTLWMMGTDASVPALEELLGSSDTVLVEAACYALRTQESAAGTTALRRSLGKASGKGLIAIINVLGDKGDAASTAKLIELVDTEDPDVVDAAIAALGKIASPDGVSALSKMHEGRNAVRRTSAAHALLQSGQELAKRKDTDAARNVYRQLTGSSAEAHIRRGALLALQGLA